MDSSQVSDNYSECKLLPKLLLCVLSLLILTKMACLAGPSVLLAYLAGFLRVHQESGISCSVEIRRISMRLQPVNE